MTNFYSKGRDFSKREKLIPQWSIDHETLINDVNRKFPLKTVDINKFINLLYDKLPKDVSKTQAKLFLQEIFILLREKLVDGHLVSFGDLFKQMQIATTNSFSLKLKKSSPSLRIKSNKSKKIKCLSP